MVRNLYSRYDVIIVGSGIAGLLLATELDQRGMRVALICKGHLLDSNTSLAQGGVAICTGANPADSPEDHLRDTISAGAGLCDETVARSIISSGPQLFEKLEELGLRFDRKGKEVALAREGGHSQARVLHSRDASGRAIADTLIAAIGDCKRLAVFEDMFACDLIMHEDRCIGLRVLKGNQVVEMLAPRVVLASGGLGQVFARTTNPSIATGDGIAMAYRAGAELADMEFVQFHPTALHLKGAPAALISEAVRGDGAQLLDRNGERFAFRFHKNGELATRDIVSRAMMTVMQEQESPYVLLDLRPIRPATLLIKYPNIVASCRAYGIDPLEEAIPVSPAAHYFMGGIWTDSHGRTSVPGLYAIGECANAGFHGANRLASNSLLEGGVMALRSSWAILSERTPVMPDSSAIIEEPQLPGSGACTPETVLEFRRKMFLEVGVIRDGAMLAALNYQKPQQHLPYERQAIECANIGLLGELIIESALARRESRGAHFRADYPRVDDRLLGRYFVSKTGNCFDPLKPAKAPVPAKTLISSFPTQAM